MLGEATTGVAARGGRSPRRLHRQPRAAAAAAAVALRKPRAPGPTLARHDENQDTPPAVSHPQLPAVPLVIRVIRESSLLQIQRPSGGGHAEKVGCAERLAISYKCAPSPYRSLLSFRLAFVDLDIVVVSLMPRKAYYSCWYRLVFIITQVCVP